MKRSTGISLLISVMIISGYGLCAKDSTTYGKTPAEYMPYGRFSEPYRRFFLEPLEYTGYGRNIPEPKNITRVKIGFIGPIIRTISETTGGIANDIPLKVNQRTMRWDGYQASHEGALGIKMLQGAMLAIEEANSAGGYRGKIPYHLVVKNDNGEWRASGKVVVDLAYKDRVWAIVGTIDGANSHIAIRVALKVEIPIMNTADTDPTFVETNIPWAIRNITDDRQMCYLLADFAFKKLKLKKVAALRANNRYGRMSIDEFRDAATRLGFPFIAELNYEDGDINYRSQLERIRNLDADGVITYGNARESALVLNQMREMGMDQWFLGSDRMVTQEFLDIIGDTPGNIAAGYPYDPTRDDPAFNQFRNNFRDRFGEYPETYASHGYDGVSMVIKAIEKAGLNRALIRDELVAMTSYHGVTGIKEYDTVFSDRSLAYLAILEDGKFEFYSLEEMLKIEHPSDDSYH